MDVKRLVWGCVVAGFATLAILAPLVIIKENVGGEAEAGTGDVVTMARIAFSPTTLTVRRGTDVTFDNQDVAPHTVTTADGRVDSGVINPGKSFRLVVQERFEYSCSIHPSMQASVELSG